MTVFPLVLSLFWAPVASARTYFTGELLDLTGQWHQPGADISGDDYTDHEDLFLLAAGWSSRAGVLTVLASSSPEDGEDEVAVTRETIVRFSAPLDAATVDDLAFRARFGSDVLPARLHVSPDRTAVTLFYQGLLPASARVRVSVDGDRLRDADGAPVDADGDGKPGGTAVIDFDTLTLSVIPGTAVCGRVFASEPATAGGQTVDSPLKGVRITVDGRETEIFTETDANGDFRLDNCPAGRFFVHVDGRQVASAFVGGVTITTRFPEGPYYPFVGKAWESIPGQEINVGNIYLPLVQANSLKEVSQTETTEITFLPEILDEYPELAGTTMSVPPGSLFADDGTPGGRVGIAPVAPDRLPGALPPGLAFPLVITVQTDGPSNFDVPVPICFPNLDGLPPGSKSALWSFNHDTGYFEVVGPMTVSEAGQTVCTDPGVGILAPGWHGTNPGSQGKGGGAGGANGPCGQETAAAASGAVQCEFGTASNLLGFTPGVGCAVSLGAGIAGSVVDCKIAGPEGCQKAVIQDMALAGLGCVPAVGGYAAAAITCANAKDAYDAMQNCYNQNGLRAAGIENGYPGNPYQDQIDLLVAAGNLFTFVFGDPKWVETDPRELPRFMEFLREVLEAIDPAGENGERLSEGERTALLALPLPSQIEPADTQALVDRIDLLAGGVLPEEEFDLDELAAAATALEQKASELAALGWETTFDGLFIALEELSRLQEAFFVTEEGAATPAEVVEAPLFYRLTNLFTGAEERGRTNAKGTLTRLILSAETHYRFEYVNPLTLEYAATYYQSAPSGFVVRDIPRALFIEDPSGDTDGDGLGDAAEAVIGTLPDNPDSDEDGIKDGAEILQGTDPLDNVVVRNGIIATADTEGRALDVDATNDIAVVADAEGGVVVLNVFNGMNPVRIARIATAGPVARVACTEHWVLSAEGRAGAAVFDVADPPAARLVRMFRPLTHGDSYLCAAAAGPLGYLGTQEGTVAIVDLEAGSIVWHVELDEAVQDLALAGDQLFVLTEERLVIYDEFARGFARRGSVPFDGEPAGGGATRRVFVGGDYAYIGYKGSFAVADVSDPDAPAVVAADTRIDLPCYDLAANGSGLLVAPLLIPSANRQLAVYDISDPLDIGRFQYSFPTPGTLRAVSIYNGLAYAADDAAGVQVVNYLSPDRSGLPPTISLDASFPLENSEIEELTFVRLSAGVGDDVQVRNVEFYINGAKVATDGNFPFEHRFFVPLRSESPELRLRARVSDTGGNFSWSDEYVFNVLENLTPPQVRSTYPGPVNTEVDVDAILVHFTKPMNPATLGAGSFQVTFAGSDGTLDTPDDEPVAIASYGYRPGLRAAVLVPEGRLRGGAYRGLVRASAADAKGIAMAGDYTWEFRAVATTLLQHLPFANPEFPVGSQPSFVAAADANQDGAPDLIAVNNLVGSVSVLLNNFDQTFDVLPEISVGGRAELAAVVDLDGDAFLDLVVPKPNTDETAVLFGRGTGAFDPPKVYPTGDEPRGVAAGDLTGDGTPEVVLINAVGHEFRVYELDAGRDLVLSATYETGRIPLSVAMADLDGDLDHDVVVTNSVFNTNVQVFRNQGDGTFEAPVLYSGGSQPDGLVIADLNDDATPDLVMTNALGDEVSVLLSAPGGGYQSRVGLRVGDHPLRVAAGDVNGDGIVDLVAATDFEDALSVLLGTGGGEFAPYFLLNAGDGVYSAAVADMDDDKANDIVFTNILSGTVGVLYNQGGGEFVPDETVPVGDEPSVLLSARFDAGETDDLAVLNVGDKIVRVLLHEGNGAYIASATLATENDPHRMAAGDIDGDGDLDLVLANRTSKTISIYRNEGSGGFTADTPLDVPATGASVRGAALARLDGDNDLDLVTLDTGGNTVIVFKNNGSGQFSHHGSFACDGIGPADVTTGDLDGNGTIDVAVNTTGSFFAGIGTAVLLNDGDGNLAATGTHYRNAVTPSDVHLANLDEDLLPDLLVSDSTTKAFYVHRNLGGGAFLAGREFALDGVAGAATLVDLDDDGDLDALFALPSLDVVEVRFNDSLGGFSRGGSYGVGDGPNDLVTVDVDGDGDWDVVTANRQGDDYSVLRSVAAP